MIGAKVMASVRLESSNNDSLVTLSPVRLHDIGYGDKNRTLELLPEPPKKIHLILGRAVKGLRVEFLPVEDS